MTAPPDYDPDVEARYGALLFLHAQSPDFRDLDVSVLPVFPDLTIETAMQLVADAPGEEIPISARLAVLYDLSRTGAPRQGVHSDAFRELASSALRLKPETPLLPPEQLLDDLAQAAAAGVPFDTTDSASSFEHHEIAFIGDDCCTIRRVQVGGIDATWVYAEFETDADFAGVADWVDPRNWHHWGPLFFRRMDLLAAPPAPATISPPPTGDQHWHGVFHEEVRLFSLVNTLLRCSYWRDTRAAAMTYELDLSLDGEIDVDRGFLLVTDTGTVRRVQVLKIVSFTTDVWDTVASLVCPFWTDWIRGAVKGATKSVPATPTQPPGTGGSCTTTMDEWAEYLGDAARVYVDIGSGATSRIRSGQYATSDLLADSTRVWSQLAKDWARAWSSWTETVEEVAEYGLDAGFTPPGVPRGPARRTAATATAGATIAGGTVVPVAGVTESDLAVSSDLVSIDVGTAIIPAADVAVSIERLADGSLGARVRTSNSSAPPSLYVGRLDTADGRPLAPVHLYVSRATGVAAP
jgi:hypothetical protein